MGLFERYWAKGLICLEISFSALSRVHSSGLRLLFLISDTGGGHRAAARAVGEALNYRYGARVRWELVDLFAAYAPWPLSLVPRSYYPLVTRYGWLWGLLWQAGQRPWLWSLTNAWVWVWNSQRLARCYQEHPADLVVSFHPLLNHVPERALRRWRPGTPFATVVTDLATAPGTWYNPAVDLLVASCGQVREAALARGVPADRIRDLGLPVGLQFAAAARRGPLSPAERARLRQRLGLLDRPTVLLAGGGEGMGPVVDVVRHLSQALAEDQVQAVVICGRNQELRRQLQQHWPIPVHVEGFVSNMADWMQAADCIVTKAGPGTIAEAMACGLPILLNSFVYGQEEGNVDFVVNNQLGVFVEDPAELARVVQKWLSSGHSPLTKMAARARQLARPQAALEVAQALHDLLR